mmetsp:Transcript_35268/g.75137  ORF Transcript_35268/g.75137 Transcript_35268/m.75137 type:complete len:84 (+) Transcript_35268:1278-1529(+)
MKGVQTTAAPIAAEIFTLAALCSSPTNRSPNADPTMTVFEKVVMTIRATRHASTRKRFLWFEYTMRPEIMFMIGPIKRNGFRP